MLLIEDLTGHQLVTAVEHLQAKIKADIRAGRSDICVSCGQGGARYRAQQCPTCRKERARPIVAGAPA